jgi:hypothetical protein
MSLPEPNSPANPPQDDALDRSIRQALSSVEPPPNLFSKIIAAAGEQDATVASAVLAKPSWRPSLRGLFAKLFGSGRLRFEDFRLEVATVTTPQLAAKMLPLDLRSGELAELLDWLREARAPKPAPDGLRTPEDFGPVGCKMFEWLGQRFSVVCFYDRGKRGVHLFSIHGRALQHAPSEGVPAWLTLGGLPTASWSRGEMSFVLVGGTPGMDLRRFF